MYQTHECRQQFYISDICPEFVCVTCNTKFRTMLQHWWYITLDSLELLTIINITNKMTIHTHKFNMTVHLCWTDFVLQLPCLKHVNATSDFLTESKIYVMQTITSLFSLRTQLFIKFEKDSMHYFPSVSYSLLLS